MRKFDADKRIVGPLAYAYELYFTSSKKKDVWTDR